jgi:hypothetical protein
MDKILNFDDVFSVRKYKTQIKLDSREIDFMNRKYSYSRQKISA